MSKTIWKYPIPIRDYFKLEMQFGARILTVQVQNKTGYIWALVDAKEEVEKRFFCLYWLGHAIVRDEYGHYIGPFQLLNGGRVYHLFEVENPDPGRGG